MVYRINIPKVQVTLDSVVTDGFLGAEITLEENAYWTATLNYSNNPAVYPDAIDVDETVKIEVKDADPAGHYTSYQTLFDGTLLYPDYSFGNENIVVALQCVGKGYGLNMMNCAEEYGTQSRNPTLDTLTEIITDSSYGVIPKWVNKYKASAYDSGYSIDTTKVETISDVIPFISSPWKPADKFLMDLCDLDTAIAQTSSLAGPHWIVDHNGYLRLKRIGATQVGWTKYYGDSQANATLTAGVDFTDGDFQPAGKGANVVLYYGLWARPSNGDGWTEATTDGWGVDSVTLSLDSSSKAVGSASLKIASDDAGLGGFYYPSTKDAAWDFTKIGSRQYIPTLNFFVSKHQAITNFLVEMHTDATHFFTTQQIGLGTTYLAETDKFYRFTLPIGNYWSEADNTSSIKWSNALSGDGDWSDIDYINFSYTGGSAGYYINLDGLHFGNVPICRIARQEFPDEIVASRGTLGTAANKIRFKTITDNLGKDDSFIASDDSGLMAQMAKAELLRLNKVVENGKFSTSLLPDVLPGQYFYIGGTDYRITKVTHHIKPMPMGLKTVFEVTDDLTNTRSRQRYEDINKVYAAIRPEFQDRQASSLKSSNMDITVQPLEKAYNI